MEMIYGLLMVVFFCLMIASFVGMVIFLIKFAKEGQGNYNGVIASLFFMQVITCFGISYCFSICYDPSGFADFWNNR